MSSSGLKVSTTSSRDRSVKNEASDFFFFIFATREPFDISMTCLSDLRECIQHNDSFDYC